MNNVKNKNILGEHTKNMFKEFPLSIKEVKKIVPYNDGMNEKDVKNIIGTILSYSPRLLFEVFDNNSIFIHIKRAEGGFSFDISDGNIILYNEKKENLKKVEQGTTEEKNKEEETEKNKEGKEDSNTQFTPSKYRSEAESKAFYQSFIILEDKLSQENNNNKK